MEAINQILDAKWKGKYTISWCGLCDSAIISCPTCNNSSCNGSSCNLCHEDFTEFAKAKTCPTQYLSEAEGQIYRKGLRIQNLILASLKRGETEINWKTSARKGNLSAHDMKHICGWTDEKIKEVN